MIDRAYWKSAVINQAAHAAVGAVVVGIGLQLGLPVCWSAGGLFVAAWLREFWQVQWNVGYALTRWRKWNDVAWFMIGAALAAKAAGYN